MFSQEKYGQFGFFSLIIVFSVSSHTSSLSLGFSSLCVYCMYIFAVSSIDKGTNKKTFFFQGN